MNVFNNKLTIIGPVLQGTIIANTGADTIVRVGVANKEDRQWVVIRNLTSNRAIYYSYNPNPTINNFVLAGGGIVELKANGHNNIYIRGEVNAMPAEIAEI